MQGDLEEEEFRTHFTQFGDIEDCVVSIRIRAVCRPSSDAAEGRSTIVNCVQLGSSTAHSSCSWAAKMFLLSADEDGYNASQILRKPDGTSRGFGEDTPCRCSSQTPVRKFSDLLPSGPPPDVHAVLCP